jgi:hypothetical protein
MVVRRRLCGRTEEYTWLRGGLILLSELMAEYRNRKVYLDSLRAVAIPWSILGNVENGDARTTHLSGERS